MGIVSDNDCDRPEADTAAGGASSRPPRRLRRIYAPPGPDGIVVYAGDLEVDGEGRRQRVRGQLELHLFPDVWFGAHLKGSMKELGPVSLFSDRELTVDIPQGASLAPPSGTILPREVPPGNSADIWEKISDLTAGDLAGAKRFVVHYAGGLKPLFRVLDPVAGGGSQGQIAFTLPGWSLRLATVDSSGAEDFSGVIEARPVQPEVSADLIRMLQRRLFAVLGLIAGREVAIGPICGLDADELVVWANWGSPRLRRGKGAAAWCPPQLVPEALPAVAAGYTKACADPAQELILERAINILMAADSGEVLDVRIPVATSGLELLAWAVLRREEGMSKKAFEGLRAGGAFALLCDWAGIPRTIPESLPHLAARLERIGDPSWGGPEIVFNVRNRLVHPPSSHRDPEWPSQGELADSWQLATWYLQMAVLRLLGYAGGHWSRLRLGRSSMDIEPVPWSAGR